MVLKFKHELFSSLHEVFSGALKLDKYQSFCSQGEFEVFFIGTERLDTEAFSPRLLVSWSCCVHGADPLILIDKDNIRCFSPETSSRDVMSSRTVKRALTNTHTNHTNTPPQIRGIISCFTILKYNFR